MSKSEKRKREEQDHHREKKRSDRKSSSKKKAKKSRHEKKTNRREDLIKLKDPLGKPPVHLIDPENDYFTKHQEFVVYLYREEGLTFNDLSSDDSRRYFRRFAKKYNRGDLEEDFYDGGGLPADVVGQVKTTKHNWDFSRDKLLSYEVDSSSRIAPKNESNPKGKGVDTDTDEKDRRVRESKSANKRLREHVRVAEEEFAGGRKEGHERRIEKKKELSRKIRDAAHDREAAPEITDDHIYGDDSSGFRAAVAREKKRKEARREAVNNRVRDLQQKEEEKQKAVFDMLGLGNLQPGQKIEIAPRKDG